MSNHDEHELLAGVNPDVTPIDDDDLERVAGGLGPDRRRGAFSVDGTGDLCFCIRCARMTEHEEAAGGYQCSVCKASTNSATLIIVQ